MNLLMRFIVPALIMMGVGYYYKHVHINQAANAVYESIQESEDYADEYGEDDAEDDYAYDEYDTGSEW